MGLFRVRTNSRTIEVLAKEFTNLDDELWGVVQGRRAEMRFEPSKERDVQEPAPEHVPEFPYAIYPLLMRRIVEEVISGRRG